MKENRAAGLKRILWTAAMSMLVGTAIFSDLREKQDWLILGARGLDGAIAGMGIYLILTMIRKHMPGSGRPSRSSVILAALFSVILLVGKSFHAANSFSPILSSPLRWCSAAVILAGSFLFFERLLTFLFERIERAPAGRDLGLFQRVFPDDANTLRIAVILLLLWLPYIIFMFPGGRSGDMTDQLRQYMGYDCRTARLSQVVDEDVYLNTMNPVAHTALMGFVMTLFMRGGDFTLGFFVFTFLQTVLVALTFARTIRIMRRIGLSRGFRLGALAFYGLNPIIPLYAYATAKDTIFSILLLLIATLLLDAFLEPERRLASPGWIAATAGSTFLFILFRNSAIFIAAVTAPAAYAAIAGIRRVRGIGRKAVLAGALVVPILLSLVVTNVVYPALSIRKGTVRENRSLLFQQTARYALTYPDEVTQEEADAIRRVLAYDDFSANYKPWNANPIKNTYNEATTEAEYAAYKRVWAEQFKKHPESYMMTMINMCYAYYYPGMNLTDYWPSFYQSHNMKIQADEAHLYTTWRPRIFSILSSLVLAGVAVLARVPGIGVLFQLGAYAWILIVMAALCLRARARVGLILIPFFALLFGVGFTAVNGSVRYMLGIIYAAPLIVALGVAGARGVRRADVVAKT